LVGLPAGWRLNSDVIIDSSSQPLFAAQIPFRGLHANMSQQELNLLKLSTRQVTESGAGTSKVVGSQFVDAGPRGELSDNAPDDLFRDAAAPNGTRLVYTTE